MPTDSRLEELAQQARFVFKGTVKKLKAATMAQVPVSNRTVIVRVDEIVHAPKALSPYAGHDITVELGGRKAVKVGQEAMFFANAWLFGKSVAVQAIDYRPVGKATAKLRSTISADPVKALADRDVRTHFDKGDLVVTGKVSSVRVLSESAKSPSRLRPREHDPMWQEAVVEVEAVHKGAPSKDTVVIRFPNSPDVAWASAPKFRAGQEGHFILHKHERAAPEQKRMEEHPAAAGLEGEGIYTALHREDFQSIHEPGGIKSLIKK